MRLACFAFLLVISSCQSAPREEHTSANSLDWAGRYQGTLPCADCEGIETTLVLSADRTFELSTRFLGRSVQPSSTKGSFEWRQNGRVIELSTSAGPRFYRVEENQGEFGGERGIHIDSRRT